MRPFILSIVLLLTAAGCQSVHVQRASNELVRTVPDLYYQQVLDNLAMTIAKPGTLPYFCLPTQGTETDTRQLNANYTPGWDFITNSTKVFGYLFDKQTAAVGGQYMNAQAYQLQPVTDPDKLTLMQIALRVAVGQPVSKGEWDFLDEFYDARKDTLPIYYFYYHAITNECLMKAQPTGTPALTPPLPASVLCSDTTGSRAPSTHIALTQANATADFSPAQVPPVPEDATPKKDPQTPAPPAAYAPPLCPVEMIDHCCSHPKAPWLGICDRKKGIPRDACYVGRCCDVWVYVPADRTMEFTRYTLALLDIASIGTPLTAHASKPGKTPADALAKMLFATTANLPLAELNRMIAQPANKNESQIRAQYEAIRDVLDAAIPEPPPTYSPLLPQRLTPFPFPAPPQ